MDSSTNYANILRNKHGQFKNVIFKIIKMDIIKIHTK